jgi:hypothetical protein
MITNLHSYDLWQNQPCSLCPLFLSSSSISKVMIHMDEGRLSTTLAVARKPTNFCDKHCGCILEIILQRREVVPLDMALLRTTYLDAVGTWKRQLLHRKNLIGKFQYRAKICKLFDLSGSSGLLSTF